MAASRAASDAAAPSTSAGCARAKHIARWAPSMEALVRTQEGGVATHGEGVGAVGGLGQRGSTGAEVVPEHLEGAAVLAASGACAASAASPAYAPSLLKRHGLECR